LTVPVLNQKGALFCLFKFTILKAPKVGLHYLCWLVDSVAPL